MGRIKIEKVEQEVLISFNAAEDSAELYTQDRRMMRKLDEAVAKNPEQFKQGRSEYIRNEIVAKRYIFPKRIVSIRTKDRNRVKSNEKMEKCC